MPTRSDGDHWPAPWWPRRWCSIQVRACRVCGISKLLTASERERLYAAITRTACWAVAEASAATVDRVNVHQASLVAIRQALEALVPAPDFAIVDGFAVPGLQIPHEAVVGGDRRCAAIAAASIVAKVTRDREMMRLHKLDARYGLRPAQGLRDPGAPGRGGPVRLRQRAPPLVQAGGDVGQDIRSRTVKAGRSRVRRLDLVGIGE